MDNKVWYQPIENKVASLVKVKIKQNMFNVSEIKVYIMWHSFVISYFIWIWGDSLNQSMGSSHFTTICETNFEIKADLQG